MGTTVDRARRRLWIRGARGPLDVILVALAKAVDFKVYVPSGTNFTVGTTPSQRVSAGRGSKGERLYDWACVALPEPGASAEAERAASEPLAACAPPDRRS
jgi:hypothetical protein